ncbi:MAG TPA: YkgJ family cysteine cluster protein, partial [Pirellulales bacterium]|nr:YkgJ family cysteine cluster protein [Pirellulales bacterium]
MSDDSQPQSATATVEVELKIRDSRLRAKMSVPAGPIRLAELLPIVYRIADVVVDSAVDDVQGQGRQISCKKGCGACCRQLVPIAEVEARQIRDLVDGLPEPRRTEVRARFAVARQRLVDSGLWQQLVDRVAWSDDVFQEIGLQYFHQGIACPFLEDESCSIHADRPSSCREYLVTSP